MAALTANRFGAVKVRPDGVKSEHPLASAGTVIYAHSLVSRDANGDIAPTDNNDLGPVMYSEKYYDATSDNLNYAHGSDEDVAQVRSGIIALLNATSMTVADVGRRVFADDDNTVSKSATEATETRPFVGQVVEFVTATSVYVYIPGVLGDNFDLGA